MAICFACYATVIRPYKDTVKTQKGALYGVPYRLQHVLTHYSGRVTQFCVFNTVKLGTSASSP